MGFNVRRYDNPADVFMRCLAVNYPKSEADELRVNSLVTKYKAEQLERLFTEDKQFEMNELDMSREGNLTQMAPFRT
jgi:hypothetical protein